MKHKSGMANNHVTSLIMLVITVIAFVCVTTTIAYAKKANEEIHSFSYDWAIDNPDNEDIYVSASLGTFWEDEEMIGNRYDFQMVNNSDYIIRNWSVDCVVPSDCDIDSYWNGFWALDGQRLVYEPEEFNLISRPGDIKTFGLIMYSPEICEMNEVTIEFNIFRPITAYPVFWFFLVIAVISFLGMFVVEIVAARIRQYAKTHAAYKDLVSESLRTIANIIDTKDEYTKGHSVRVAIYSRMIAERMGMDAYEQERIYYIGLLHDIGKIGIPASILTKPGRLNDEEFEIIKRHPAMGAQIMKDFSSIPGVQNGIKYHHERYDGRGYNEGLKGDAIPIEGRIICVADSYDAMSSRRCYRNSLSYDFILDELKRNSGTQFDPEILKHMIAMVEGGYAPVSDAEMEDYEI